MLGLQLSSHSFLDSSIEDCLSAAPVYVTKTADAFTTVLRCSGEEDFIQIATIKWPGVVSTKDVRKEHDHLLIKMRGCHWSRGQAFLRRGSNSKYTHKSHYFISRFQTYAHSSRNFTIPDYPHPMKWKRYGTSYWVGISPTCPYQYLLTGKQCTTTAIKGPIATMDLTKGQPLRLAVYETLHDKFDPQGLSTYQGVSSLLLDYLIVTALLSVTDASAWTLLENVGVQDMAAPHSADSGGQRLPYAPPFPDQSKGLYRARSETSLTSLATTLPAFPQSSRCCDSGMPTCVEPDPSSCLKRYSTSTMEDWAKTYRASLYSNDPTASTEDVQHAGVLPYHRSVRTSSHSSHTVVPVPSPQLSEPPTRPRAGTSASHNERSYLLDQPRRIFPLNIEYSASSEQLPNVSNSIHSPSKFESHCPLGLEQEIGSTSSEQPLNNSTLAHCLRRSESHRRPLPKPPRVCPQSSTLSTEGPKRNIRSLPATPIMEQDRRRTSVLEGNSRLQPRTRIPPMTAESQEDLTQWVHELTNPVRVLPPVPLSETVVLDVPPPAYDSIKFCPTYTPPDSST